MARVSIQDTLEYCLANPDGLGVEELLATFPEYREELQPLLALSSSVGEIAPPPVPAERRAAMKMRLMEAAAAQSQAAQVGPQHKREIVQQGRRQSWIWSVLRRPAFGVAGLLAAMIIVLWWGAASALPDSPLYGVKLASENVIVNFAGGAAQRASSHLDLAKSRLDDIEATRRQGNLVAVDSAVKNFGEHMSNSTVLWKETTDGENETIKSGISGAITRFERVFKSFDEEVATLPGPVRGDIGQVYKDLSDIRGEINELPYIEVPPGIDIPITPTLTQGVPDPTREVATGVVTAAPTEVSAATEIAPVRGTETPRGGASATVAPEYTRVATAEPTSGPASATASATVVRGTATPKRGVTASPTVRPRNTAVPSRTSTIGVGSKTKTPGAGRRPSRTPTRTYTAISTATVTRDIAASPTSRPPEPAATATFVDPPPIPHTTTPKETIEHPPHNTALPTNVMSTHVPPTAEEEPTRAVCVLHIDDVTVESSCETNSDVSWSADVENESSTAQRGNWLAVLLVKGRSGGYREVDRASGVATFPPRRSSTIEDRFSKAVPADAEAVRVLVTLNESGRRCDDSKQDTKECKE